MKILIYARGRLLHKNAEKINWNDVVAVLDKSAKRGEIYQNSPVLLPNEIEKLRYDYLAIFSDIYYEEIRSELIGVFFVPSKKIISWKGIVIQDDNKYGFVSFLKKYLHCNQIHYALDAGGSCLSQFYCTKESLCEKIIRLDKIGSITYDIEKNLYDHVYTEFNVINTVLYDLTILWNVPEKGEKLIDILKKSKKCLIMVQYMEVLSKKTKAVLNIIEEYYSVQIFQHSFGEIWEIRKKCSKTFPQTHIYVVTHKKYNVLEDSLYKPIIAGKFYRNDHFLCEQKNENIAYLNEKINECTVLYWIWKNTNDEYVGLNHYRRYFCNNGLKINGNYLKIDRIAEILEDYDIILSDLHILYGHVVADQIRFSVQDDDVYQQGYNLMQSGIRTYQPDYLDTFEYVMNGYREYICNLFVTKRNILNSYCEWLFSFLIEVAEKMDISQCNDNSKRVIGFFAERMWTVWILKQDLKIKELPFLLGV